MSNKEHEQKSVEISYWANKPSVNVKRRTNGGGGANPMQVTLFLKIPVYALR